SRLPLAGAEQLNFLGVEGQPPVPRGQEPVADERTVTPGYFQALGVPLVRGRLFTERDVPGQPRVVIVNETLARRFFPREDPIGKRIKFGRV
ncbi:MAG: ABC transporter permease, partial [Acidobacteria bacterium]|nr:ABC transporter permease [Acidobacteriota bacterium]